MQPTTVNLPDHTLGDTWEGVTIGPIVIDGAAPAYPVVSCELQVTRNGAVEYELNNAPGAGEGTVVINNAALWTFTVAPLILGVSEAAKYKWRFRATDSAGTVRTFYRGDWKITE